MTTHTLCQGALSCAEISLKTCLMMPTVYFPFPADESGEDILHHGGGGLQGELDNY